MMKFSNFKKNKVDTAFMEGAAAAMKVYFKAESQRLPAMIAATVDQLALPLTLADPLTLDIWKRRAQVVGEILRELTGRDTPLEVEQEILDLAKRRNVVLNNPYQP